MGLRRLITILPQRICTLDDALFVRQMFGVVLWPKLQTATPLCSRRSLAGVQQNEVVQGKAGSQHSLV